MCYNAQQLAEMPEADFRKYYNEYVTYYKELSPEQRQSEQEYAAVMQAAYKMRQEPHIELEYAPEICAAPASQPQQASTADSKQTQRKLYSTYQPILLNIDSSADKTAPTMRIKLMPKWLCIVGAIVCFAASPFLCLLLIAGFTVHFFAGILFSVVFLVVVFLGVVCCKQYLAQKKPALKVTPVQQIAENFKNSVAGLYKENNSNVEYDDTAIKLIIWNKCLDACVDSVRCGDQSAVSDWNSIVEEHINLQNSLREILRHSDQPTIPLLFMIVSATSEEDVLLEICDGVVTYDATAR